MFRSRSGKMTKYLCWILYSICYNAIRSTTFQCQVRCYVGGCWPTLPHMPIMFGLMMRSIQLSFQPMVISTQHLVDNISTHIFHSHCSSYRVPVASCWTLSLSVYFCLKDKTRLVPGRLYCYLVMTQERRGEDQQDNQFVGMLMAGPYPYHHFTITSQEQIISQPDVRLNHWAPQPWCWWDASLGYTD